MKVMGRLSFVRPLEINQAKGEKQMKKGTMLLMAVLATAAFSTAGYAEEGHKKGGHITGEVTKIDGDMVTVKDMHGEEHMLHVDKTTKKMGELKVGEHVMAEATDSGHAKSIEEEKPH
jgi:hypothetical protein